MIIPQRKPYAGTEKLLVIGIDIGTTLSGMSYALLEPGKMPQIQPVTRFSGQREENNNLNVPSVIYYDQDGKIVNAGSNEGLSGAEGVRRAEWFKLRLWPPHLTVDKRSQIEKLWSPPEPAEVNEDCAKASDEDKDKNDVPTDIECGGEGSGSETLNKKKIPLPVTDDFKTVLQLFTDFLQYLFKSAKEYIIDSETKLDPTFKWSAIERNINFVLTHPNGWEGRQQSLMREAAVEAGLVDISMAANRISFVTEGEANFHFCLDKMPELYQVSGGLLVVDCGGGAIGLNTYSRTVNGGFEEIVSSDSLVQGSIFVTSRARDYFKGKLKDSNFGTDNCVEAICRAFDKPDGVKCIFDSKRLVSFVSFSCLRCNDRTYGITGGKIKVESAQVAKFFEPAVQEIIAGIEKQRKNTKDGVSIKYILLVGGFGRSPYLFKKLSDYFETHRIAVRRPDDNQNDPGSYKLKPKCKEAAHGAVSWYLDRCVSARVAKYSYGVTAEEEFNPENPEHVRRESTKFAYANGKFCIPGVFSTILKRDTGIFEGKEFRQSHSIVFTLDEYSRCCSIVTNLKCYRGKADTPPEWIDLEPNSFHDLCIIQVDMPINIKRRMKLLDSGQRLFYKFNLDLVIPFGSTELKVYIAWQEDGIEKRYAFCVEASIRELKRMIELQHVFVTNKPQYN